MNKYDMTDFISAITECCSDFSSTWEDNSVLDLNKLHEIKTRLNNFILDKKKDIMDLYDYASAKGKYKPVDVPNLLPIIEDFEGYFSDLNNFIKAMLNIKGENAMSDKSVETISKASNADEAFFNKYFGSDRTIDSIHTTFSTALTQIEMLMHINVLLGDIEDMYIVLNNSMNNMSERMKMITDLYSSSTMRFLNRIVNEVVDYISTLLKVKDSVITGISESENNYKLL